MTLTTVMMMKIIVSVSEVNNSTKNFLLYLFCTDQDVEMKMIMCFGLLWVESVISSFVLYFIVFGTEQEDVKKEEYKKN